MFFFRCCSSVVRVLDYVLLVLLFIAVALLFFLFLALNCMVLHVRFSDDNAVAHWQSVFGPGYQIIVRGVAFTHSVVFTNV
jgi:hypothetical protein